MDIGELLAFSVKNGASDLHLSAGLPPMIRVHGDVRRINVEALDHKFHAQGLSVLCVKPGFVKTGMTAGLKPPPFAGEPEQVARDVVRAMDRRRPMLYTPGMWALVMLVIRWLPRFVMRKINF